MRTLCNLIFLGLLIICFMYAKDDLLADIKSFLSLPQPAHSAIVHQGGTIEVVFSPNQGATKAIIQAIEEAQSLILVSAYSFTSKDLAAALLKAKKRGVDIKLILDKSQVSQKYSASTFFANMGFDLKIDNKHAIYHNKIMVIDKKTVITGSFNFTKAAETKNAENVLIIRNNPSIAQLYSENFWFHWRQSISRNDALNRKN